MLKSTLGSTRGISRYPLRFLHNIKAYVKLLSNTRAYSWPLRVLIIASGDANGLKRKRETAISVLFTRRKIVGLQVKLKHVVNKMSDRGFMVVISGMPGEGQSSLASYSYYTHHSTELFFIEYENMTLWNKWRLSSYCIHILSMALSCPISHKSIIVMNQCQHCLDYYITTTNNSPSFQSLK